MTTDAAPRIYEWLTVKEAAARAKCSTKLIYLAVSQGRLRGSRLGVRKDIRILESWLDAWITSLSTPTLINPDAPGEDIPAGIGPLSFTRHGRKPTPK
jgi:excisionase family DNA binding protein